MGDEGGGGGTWGNVREQLRVLQKETGMISEAIMRILGRMTRDSRVCICGVKQTERMRGLKVEKQGFLINIDIPSTNR